MKQYPKRILDVSQQLQSYIDAGMIVSSKDEAISALQSIGYYRLRGYCYHLYDNATKKYKQGTAFVDGHQTGKHSLCGTDAGKISVKQTRATSS